VAGQMCVGAGSVHAAAPVLAEHSCYYMLLRFGALVVRVRAIGLRRIRARRASLFACWAGSGSRPLNADMSASRPAHALCHAGMPVHGRCARTTRAWKHANNTARCRSWTRAASSGPWPTCGPGGPRAAAATLTSHMLRPRGLQRRLHLRGSLGLRLGCIGLCQALCLPVTFLGWQTALQCLTASRPRANLHFKRERHSLWPAT